MVQLVENRRRRAKMTDFSEIDDHPPRQRHHLVDQEPALRQGYSETDHVATVRVSEASSKRIRCSPDPLALAERRHNSDSSCRPLGARMPESKLDCTPVRHDTCHLRMQERRWLVGHFQLRFNSSLRAASWECAAMNACRLQRSIATAVMVLNGVRRRSEVTTRTPLHIGQRGGVARTATTRILSIGCRSPQAASLTA
jgi:hypothetical protein